MCIRDSPCPLFVPLVEAGYVDHSAPDKQEITKLVIAQYLTEIRDAGVDTLILGCTHYPLIKTMIGEFMGRNVVLVEDVYKRQAASLVEDGRRLLSNVISTSVKEQALYGGVVPEIASRRHCEFISATVKKALLDAGKTMDDVDAVAVTFAPGLIGAVLVGVNFAKGLAYSCLLYTSRCV